MARMTRKELERIVSEAIEQSTWSDDSESKQNQRAALDSYYGRNKPKTTDGLSGICSSDVADMVEAVVAQIMPAFDFDEVAVFDARFPDEVEAVRAESRVCNTYLRDKNKGYGVVQQALRNALLLRNCIIKVYGEERIDVSRETRRGLTPLELQMSLEPTAPRQTVQIVGDVEGNETDGLEVKIKRTTTFKRLNITSIDPLCMVIEKNWDDISLFDCPVVGERYYLTESDLIGMGVPKTVVKDLPSADTDSTVTATARERSTDTNLPDYGHNPLRQIECFELYMLVDVDGDGHTERRRILYAGQTQGGKVLFDDPWYGVPYASGTAFIAPQRWKGVSLYDKLKDLEDAKTDALRQYADNLAYANNCEVKAIDGAVNMDDLKARRPGGINRVLSLDAVAEMPFQSNGQESIAFLNYMDQVRSERGGASLDLQNAQIQLAGDTAHGVERQYTSKEQLSQLMTRTLAETVIRETFLLIHMTLRNEFPERQVVNAGGQFMEYTPGNWPYRDELNIVAGMSVGERRERRAVLEGMLAQQQLMGEQGLGDGILVDLETHYATLLDWAAAGGIQNPRRYVIDPRTPESQEAQQLAIQRAQQQAQQQMALNMQVLETQIGVEREKNHGDLVAKAGQLQYDYWKTLLESVQAEGDEQETQQAQDVGKQRANETPAAAG